MNSELISNKASKLKALFLDVDGVLTDGTFYLTENAKEIKRFHTQDGVGLKALQRLGITLAIISGRNSEAVNHRMLELDIKHVFQGISNKKQVFLELLETLKLEPYQVGYMGDDLPDLELLTLAGLSIAPSNATHSVKKAAHWVTDKAGGYGAVREVCDYLLEVKTKENNER